MQLNINYSKLQLFKNKYELTHFIFNLKTLDYILKDFNISENESNYIYMNFYKLNLLSTKQLFSFLSIYIDKVL